MANLLAREKSPYLLQHAENPVDWHPWGIEAFAKAQEEDKPVFLSVGYATCHWCHVMAHESFEDPQVADLLNRHFVCIKVDREERPDVDSVYMTVCQALTGGGGWPLSIFMTPDKKPFYAGTYFPKYTMPGRPGLMELAQELARLWREDRARLLETGDKITQAVQPQRTKEKSELGFKVLEKAYWMLDRAFDPRNGGFSSAPKFPTPHQLSFLMRWHLRRPKSHALAMALKTLRAMRGGGIYDHVGLGFHRYSVDERWLVPHFEKMLYDQALLSMAYTEAFLLSKKDRHRRTVEEISTYVMDRMTSPEGGFYSAEDADSEGKEGWFYVWTPQEVLKVLGEKLGKTYLTFYNITDTPSFEWGKSIPHARTDIKNFAKSRGMGFEEAKALFEDARQKMHEAREQRVHPLKDDKVLASWNGLMIAALAKAGRALCHAPYIQAAARAADFVLAGLAGPGGGLVRSWRDGQAGQEAFLDDYAFMAWGLIELYQAGFDPKYLRRALEICRYTLDNFWDDIGGGFFFCAHTSENHIIKEKDLYDGAVPSGNSVWCLNLLVLARLTGDPGLERKALKAIQGLGGQVERHPLAYTQFLQAVDFMLGPSSELVIAGEPGAQDTKALLAAANQDLHPRLTLMLCGPDGGELAELVPFVREMKMQGGRAAAYLCQNQACQKPLTDPAELAEALEGQGA